MNSACRSQSDSAKSNGTDTLRLSSANMRDFFNQAVFEGYLFDTIRIMENSLGNNQLKSDTCLYYLRVTSSKAENYLDTVFDDAISNGDCYLKIVIISNAILAVEGCNNPSHPRIYFFIKFHPEYREHMSNQLVNVKFINTIILDSDQFDEYCSALKIEGKIIEYKYFRNSFVDYYW